ncbi:MAG: hypothetical protein PHU14_00070 [Methylovulum sp.]|nr:hypothetical protein [Methylovulum sp.]
MLADLLALVKTAVRDDAAVISDDDYVSAISMAVNRYSADRPRYLVEDLTANGTAILDLPSGWQVGFSIVISLEYPLDNFPPEMVDTGDYLLYQAPVGEQLRLAYAPDSAVRMTYTQAHVLDDSTDTLPVPHREAIMSWAAAACCEQLASYYASASDSTIQADRVERLSQSRDYANRAKTLRERYTNELGVDDKKSAPAGVVVNWDLQDSRGNDRFTHSKRWR